MENWIISSCEGPVDCGSYGGSLVGLGASDIIITSDPHMYLYSEVLGAILMKSLDYIVFS